MSSSRVYVGGLRPDITERELEEEVSSSESCAVQNWVHVMSLPPTVPVTGVGSLCTQQAAPTMVCSTTAAAVMTVSACMGEAAIVEWAWP